MMQLLEPSRLPGSVLIDSDVHRDMRWCTQCAGEQIFVEVYEYDSGRVGVCLGCGREAIVPFTRTTEAAA